MGEKHGWTKESKYIQIHKGVLRKFGITKEYQLERVTDQYFVLSISFEMITNKGKKVIVSIKKDCEVDTEQKLKDPLTKTYAYTYHARYSDGRNLIRYCSPDKGHGHRAKHHKHVYDTLGKQIKVSPLILKEGSHPHVSEFLEEISNNF